MSVRFCRDMSGRGSSVGFRWVMPVCIGPDFPELCTEFGPACWSEEKDKLKFRMQLHRWSPIVLAKGNHHPRCEKLHGQIEAAGC